MKPSDLPTIPIDCRTCAHFRQNKKVVRCVAIQSDIICVNGSHYNRTAFKPLWRIGK